MAYFDSARGKWRGSVYFMGKRKTKLFGEKDNPRKKDKKEAEAWEHSMRTRLALERYEKGKYSLLKATDEYLEDCDKKTLHKTTIANKKHFLKELLALVGDIDLARIEPKALKDYIYSKEKPSQSNRARKDLSAFFAYCVKFFSLKDNPINLIDKLPEERKEQLVPNEKQVARLLFAVDRWDRNFLLVYLLTGARKEEILRWKFADDVDFNKRQVRLGTKKGRTREMKYRRIGMDDVLYQILQDQLNTKLDGSDYVFQNRNARFNNYGDRFQDRKHFVRNICKKINKAGGEQIPIFGYHSLRRFYTSVLVEQGTKLQTLQRLLGHARPSTTDLYIKTISEDIQAAQERIGGIMDGLLNGKSEEEKEEQDLK